MKNDSLGDRMKQYESVSKNYLTRRIPVIVRVDGKAFHTFCKRFERPYDTFFNDCMNNVMKYICENVQGAKFAERHSDEISILITDYDKITTDAYFDYSVQKIVSVISSMATAELCRWLSGCQHQQEMTKPTVSLIEEIERNKDILSWEESWPMFDCRCFNIPKEEIENYFWWRMLDAKRNSINMLAQSLFSHKQLQGKTCDEMQEMMFQEHGVNWNNIDQGQKAGFMCFKTSIMSKVPKGPNAGEEYIRRVWDVMPSVSQKHELDEAIEFVFHT